MKMVNEILVQARMGTGAIHGAHMCVSVVFE